MFGRGKKYRVPSHLLPTVRTFQEFKDPATQAHVRLKNGKEHVIWIWYLDRIWAIRGYTYLPFSGCDIEDIYQTEEDRQGEPRDAAMMLLDEGAFFQLLSVRRWRLKYREVTAWFRKMVRSRTGQHQQE